MAIEDEPEFSDIDLFSKFPISDDLIKCVRVRNLQINNITDDTIVKLSLLLFVWLFAERHY